MGGLALPGRGPRPPLPALCGLVDRRPPALRDRRRRLRDGDSAAPSGIRPRPSLRPRLAIRLACHGRAPARGGDRDLDGREGIGARQRRRRVVLLDTQARAFNRRSWPTKADARVALVEWIEAFHNRQRIHTKLGYYAPRSLKPSPQSGRGSGLRVKPRRVHRSGGGPGILWGHSSR